MPATPIRLAALAAPALMLLACTSSSAGPDPTPSTSVRTVIKTRTSTPSIGSTAPVSTGPTRVRDAAACPLLPTQQAADRVGMRLARITVLHSGGRVVGCRFYALQNSPLHNSENLPGPHQPAIEIETTRYASSIAAHNAFVIEARHGTDPQRARIGNTIGVCFQIDFYAHDKGQDWSCAFNLNKTKVSVRTVVVSPALNVEEISRAVAKRL